MWYGRIQDLNIWKEDSKSNKLLSKNPGKEIQCNNESVTFYMGQQLLTTDIGMLNLSVRSYHCLRRAGWNTVGDIISNIENWQDLLKVRNLGRTSALEIIKNLKEYQDTLLTESEKREKTNRKNEETKVKIVGQNDDMDLSKLNLSARAYNSLKRAGYSKVSELLEMIQQGGGLRDIRSLGAASEKEILAALKVANMLCISGGTYGH